MSHDKKNIYTADSRFVVSFLLEESLQGPDQPDPKPRFRPKEQDLAVYKNHYTTFFADAGEAFSTAADKITAFVCEEEFQQWSETGLRLSAVSKDNPALVLAFLDSSESVFAKTSFTYLKGWVEKGLEIAEYSLSTAIAYYELTPLFIQLSNNLLLQKWGDWCLHLVAQDEPQSRLGRDFLEQSITCLNFMTLREFREYKNLGFMFFRIAPKIGKNFFAKSVGGLSALDITQRRTLYQLTKKISRHNETRAFSFFADYPVRLADISPNERNRVLKIVETLTKTQPAQIPLLFSHLLSALKAQPYPRQILILAELERVIDKSSSAGQSFLLNVHTILSQIPDCFLSQFIDAGISTSRSSENADVERYFSLTTPGAHRELHKWGSAAQLEDHRNTMSVLATAMTGTMTAIQDTQVLENVLPRDQNQYATTNGKTIYLPDYMANTDSAERNFDHYKIATAHQAGLIEFKTFSADLPVMVKMLSDLPQAQLALDIFFVLEHGRIDFQIARNYKGLKKIIEHMLWEEINQRVLPEDLPLKEAVLEILVLYSVIPFNPDYARSFKTSSPFLSSHIEFLNQTLAGFYEHNNSVWYCFEKTYAIYHYLEILPNHKPGRAEEPYHPCLPLAFRGRIYPALIQPEPEKPVLNVSEAMPNPHNTEKAPGLSDSPNGEPDPYQIKLSQTNRPSGPGILLNPKDISKFLSEHQNSKNPWEENSSSNPAGHMALDAPVPDIRGFYFYDEWDYVQKAYRKKWCRLKEINPAHGSLDKINKIYQEHGGLIRKVKKQFQQIKPMAYENLSRVDWGDEIDLVAVIEGVANKKAGNMPSDKVFIRKERKKQNLSVLFLVDMSASTGNPVIKQHTNNDNPQWVSSEYKKDTTKKIIDVEIESLVIITEALETLGHDHAIYGFSGYGRENIDVYALKEFKDPCSDELKKRLGGMEAKKSTRMGTAIRHSLTKLEKQETEQRLLILLSDGFPQDYDYGEDRSSYEYGIHDTMMALLEAKLKNIRPFCITVDHEGKDYLKKMCEPGSYLVIQDIYSLPEMLPKIVASLIH